MLIVPNSQITQTKKNKPLLLSVPDEVCKEHSEDSSEKLLKTIKRPLYVNLNPLYFKVDNYFSEIDSKSEQLAARINLGIDGATAWGHIEGNIQDQKDLMLYLGDNGIISVTNLSELGLFITPYLKDGTLAYVSNLDLYYLYKNRLWQKASFNSLGIPIYSLEKLDKLVTQPDDYILIRDDEYKTSEVLNNTYTTNENGKLIDVLFSALRALLSEVARIKNSFKYGIVSYTENNTAMSKVLGQFLEPEEEPLWAVEEDTLSELLECTMNMDVSHDLIGDVIVNEGVLDIKEAVFKDPEKGFKVLKDPKSLLFITSTGKDIEINLKIGNYSLNVNLLELEIPEVALYNILIIVSKKTTKTVDDPTLYGLDFVWIQVTDAKTNDLLKSGYYNGNSLQNNLFLLEHLYYINEIKFTNLQLSKFNAYTKLLDFSYEVIPSAPEEDLYKLETAHLAIRSVSNEGVLEKVKNLLLENELVWVENTKKLCIKSKGKIYNIGGINNDNSMTTQELIATLETLGIVIVSKDNDQYDIKLNDISSIKFVHEATGKRFNIEVDSEGNLISTPELSNLIEDRLKNITLNSNINRGFISNLRISESQVVDTKDVGLLSDRLKIGAIYSPKPGRTIFGCSHAYIELENTSDLDITLNGCYLHLAIPGELNTEIKTLPLKGSIKAGSTFLIRCKLYAELNDVNTIIKVKTFDQEWYDKGLLLDLQKDLLCLMLLYGINSVKSSETYIKDGIPLSDDSATFEINPYYIDGTPVRDNTLCDWIKATILINDGSITRDYILKNTFELDPAKQAFLALYPKDSSRIRGVNKNDFKPFYIDTSIITFPNSDPTYDVSLITPKASFENKNVSTDKTKLDVNKPNMVYCSFGINMHTTRCFNWISVGSFDEFVWVRKQGSNLWVKMESYKTLTEETSSGVGFIYRKEFPLNINNNVYARMQGRFPGDGSFYTAHKCIAIFKQTGTFEYVVGRLLINGNFDPEHSSEIATFTIYPENTIPRVYHITDLLGFYWMEYQTWAGAANALYDKIKNDIQNDLIMPVIINTGDVTLNGTRVNEWLDYYLAGLKLFKEFEHMSVVGNNDLCGTDYSVLGTGDDVGKSNGYYHHLFNCYEIDTEDLIVNDKYIPSTYYFECLNNGKYVRFVNVNSELTFINCRDWFGLRVDDNVVYNIYTGWTAGNNTPVDVPLYTSLFVPVYNTLYKWLTETNRECIVACHEIPFTVMTRQNLSLSKPGYTEYSRSVDGKSGSLVGSHLNQLTKSDNTALYWFSRLLEYSGVKICLGGHKHTYTCTYPVREFYFYEDSKNSLTDGPMEMGTDLSNEYSNGNHLILWNFVKENESLLKTSNNALFSSTEKDLKDSFSCFIKDGILFNTSRLPIVKFEGTVQKVASKDDIANYTQSDLNDKYLPIIGHSGMNNGVIYFMCQATGYKQTSNKELPGTAQAFSLLLPLTTYDSSKDKDTASAEQQVPMFGILKWNGNDRELLLLRIMNIQASTKKPLYNNIGEYGTLAPTLLYINCTSDNYVEKRFGKWLSEESNILTYQLYEV